MGTTYNITLEGDPAKKYKTLLEAELKSINASVNTYDPNADISRFNASANDHSFGTDLSNDHFYQNLKAADKVVAAANGLYDPTVMPLVNYWGFGTIGKRPVLAIDSQRVDSLLQFVGWGKIGFTEKKLTKKHPAAQLDFSSIAKGYGVDRLGLLLAKEGVNNYLVEIGGEVRARGINRQGAPWRLGISRPLRSAAVQDFQLILPISNTSLASSGNYRIFYETKEGTYAHTINPQTGFPEQSKLLSASVVTKECMFADAYATAFMAMGLEKSVALVEKLEGVEAIFIYNDGQGALAEKASTGLQSLLEE